MWEKLFKKDSLLLGIGFGLVFPAAFYFVLLLLDHFILAVASIHMLAKPEYLYILSIVINLFAIKYYFVNLGYDKTGRGILLVTFIYAIVYFVLY